MPLEREASTPPRAYIDRFVYDSVIPRIRALHKRTVVYNRAMKLIFAQGNPGSRYEKTRHNVGFLVLDALKEALNGSEWKKHPKANGIVSEITLNGEKSLLVKPMTYYNETGMVARSLIDFYKLSPKADLLVIHDDLALPVGTVRVRQKGSDAGNNGIKSLNQHLGGDYTRLRIGIWNDKRDRMEDADFVLSKFNRSDRKLIDQLIKEKILQITEGFLENNLETTSHTL